MKRITVIGLGYVGLPVACICASAGYEVYGVDVDEKKISKLNKGICPIKDKDLEKEFSDVKDNFKATTDIDAAVKNADIIVICVPTPVDKNHSPDLTALKSAANSVSKSMKENTLVIVESTIFPGTSEEIILPILKKSNVKKFYLAHCPERIDPGNEKFTIKNIPRVVGGIDDESLKKAVEFYETVIQAPVTELSSIKAAEATKIMENTFRDINIAFINEMAMSFDKAGIDILEVIKGAETKPFAFKAHYPGAGVGGHCFDKNTKIFLINSNHHKIESIGPYIDSLDCRKQAVNGSEIFYPQNVKVLSFDMIKNRTSFKPVTIASKRKVKSMLRIICPYNYKLEVTELHPVIVYNNKLKVKFAKDLKSKDKLILNKLLPEEKNSLKIDIIEHLDSKLSKKIRVKPKNCEFSRFKRVIDKNLKGDKHDYYRWNFLPLKKFLKIERLLGLKRDRIFLCTGKGPSFNKFPAVLKIDKNFLRLIGYYLSEGCITKDKSLRTRFTFNKNEKEYIDDLKSILDKFNFKHSSYLDKKFDTYYIKVSSNIFGFILKDILKCGTNCYNMQIPEIFFDLRKSLKEEILKGMFRGDGGVSWYNKKRKYSKNGGVYEHQNNSIEVSYFTSSNVLFQQVVLLLLNQEIVPKLAKRDGYLSVLGPKDVTKVKDWFLGEKKEKIENYLKSIDKNIDYKKTEIHKNFITLDIDKVIKVKTDCVYSMEVKETGTLIATDGIIAHNCIPVDPYYLIEKAKSIGFSHRFLKLARDINNNMPSYTIQLLEDQLDIIGVKIKDADVGILGLAYKPNVDDTRESPSFEVIKILKNKGANVFIFDPHISEHSNVMSIQELLKKSDYIILITCHKEFLNIDICEFKKNNIKIIIDGRNCLDSEKIKSLGIAYHGIGRS